MGEVYEINDRLLERLDKLENHPDDYHREEIQVILLSNNQSIKAWIYLNSKKARRYPHIASGNW